MEIFIAVLAYLLHCFTAFVLIYSYDKAKIWGDKKDEPSLCMPRLTDVEEQELLSFSADDTEEDIEHKQRVNDARNRLNQDKRQKYVDEVIKPATLYFSLKKEIEQCQSKNDGFFTGFVLQLFSLLLASFMLVISETIESWIISVITAAALCSISCYFIYQIYNRYWRCRNIRIQHFNYDSYDFEHYAHHNDETEKSYKIRLNNSIILRHYEYLYSIRDTVVFRCCVRKILHTVSIIIYILFFFVTHE